MSSNARGHHFWLRVALLVYAVGIFAYRDALMDDTFIHLQYARNLRAHGELAFNTGEPSLGASSPFWVLVLALLGPSLPVARLASVGFGALAVWLMALQARRHCGGGAVAVAATLAWAGNIWLLRHAPNGMETTAAAACVLLAFELRARGLGAWNEAALGLCLGAAWLVRPELALLGGIFLAQDLWRPQRWRRLRCWLPVAALVGATWAIFAWSRTGRVLPDTASAKAAGPAFAAAFAVLWREARLLVVAHPVEAVGLALATVWGLRLTGADTVRQVVTSRLVPHALFVVLLLLVYAVLDVQVQPRYLVPALPCLTLAGFAAWRAVVGGSGRAAFALVAACLAASTAASALGILQSTRDYSRALRPALVTLTQTLAERAGEGANVATPDIGLVGWYGRQRVVDLGGLIAPKLQELRRSVGDDSLFVGGAFLALEPAEFLIDRSRTPERFAGHRSHGRRWTVLGTTTIPNLGLSRPGPYYYTLYALEPDEPSS